jgi:flagellar biosynthesis anti-sigma factor FlgM
MRINPDKTRLGGQAAAERVARTENAETRPGSVAAAKAGGADAAILSDKAQDIMCARRAYDELPDVRAAKVAQFTAQISSGKFTVDAEAVVDKLMSGGS